LVYRIYMFTWNLSLDNIIYLVYSGYIPLIYLVYIRFQDFVGSIRISSSWAAFTFGLCITFISAPVYFWIFSAWTGMRFQARPTTQRTTCWCPKAQYSDPDALFPFRNTEEVLENVAAERRRLLHRDGTPRDRC
jgi:hypothetical protein